MNFENTDNFKKSSIHKARQALAFFITLFLLTSCLQQADETLASKSSQEVSIYVIKVKDGDSLIVRGKDKKELEVRLFGIDAPELDQPYGKQSRNALTKLAFKQSLKMQVIDTDKYERAVVTLSNDKFNLNQKMLEQGHAWLYRKYQSDNVWIELENSAKRSKRGLWKFARPVAPWEWRQRKRKQLK